MGAGGALITRTGSDFIHQPVWWGSANAQRTRFHGLQGGDPCRAEGAGVFARGVGHPGPVTHRAAPNLYLHDKPVI